MMLSDVCRAGPHPVGGRMWASQDWLLSGYWLIGPGSAGLAQGCRCALPLQAWAGHIVATAHLQLVSCKLRQYRYVD